MTTVMPAWRVPQGTAAINPPTVKATLLVEFGGRTHRYEVERPADLPAEVLPVWAAVAVTEVAAVADQALAGMTEAALSIGESACPR